ncbi:Nif3-like dinuclear metal center hexameric protein [Schaalia sp. ZJ405]|uniref:Nif3-like dinuclear metal center hexameric protein n=1 Tax=unclassified Schaalia TaxID=2691889 RepID=UPI0013EC31B3|nr:MULTISPECIES: Nif3-like dinuclear metal center hexameric protein [unclassified Schaalia]QPK82020.1 Nif3-like dinuclear metal center hexameric protein [Schaalia sp. ZJ405]
MTHDLASAATNWTVGDICALMDRWFPPANAQDWDKVGLILGDRDRIVRRVLLAVDPVASVGRQATTMGDGEGADLIITHHPLFLRGVSFLPEDQPKGALVTQLIRSGIALLNAHTNADIAHDGVADALARLIGLSDPEPLEFIGEDEDGHLIGMGRIGRVTPTTLGEFAAHVASVLPAGPTGLFVGGDTDSPVERIAVAPGAGDSFLDLARKRGADVFLTADLRHHPASEHMEAGRPFLLCGSHWATEWPWLRLLEKKLTQAAAREGVDLSVEVSTIVTEPWTQHLETSGELA